MRDTTDLKPSIGEWTVEFWDDAYGHTPEWKTIVFWSYAPLYNWLEKKSSFEDAVKYLLEHRNGTYRIWRLKNTDTGEIIPGELFHE